MYFIDNDPALRHVDPKNRAEVTRFQHEDEAQLAAGCYAPTAFRAS